MVVKSLENREQLDYNCDTGLYAMFFVIFATSVLHHPLQASALQTPLPPTIINLALAHSTALMTQSTISYSGPYERGNPLGRLAFKRIMAGAKCLSRLRRLDGIVTDRPGTLFHLWFDGMFICAMPGLDFIRLWAERNTMLIMISRGAASTP